MLTRNPKADNQAQLSSDLKQYVISVIDKPYYPKNQPQCIHNKINPYLNNSNEVKNLGTEIHTFTSLKDLTEYLAIQTSQYKALFEDYSQWLGSVLRDCESSHKSDEWFQKSAALQKTLKAPVQKAS